MLDIIGIKLFLADEIKSLYFDNNICQYNDIRIEFNDNKLLVTGHESQILGFDVTIKNVYFKDALIMGDAFERAYGDLEWQKPDIKRILPWYFMAEENGKMFGFGVKTLPNAFCEWQCDKDEIILNVNLKNGSNPLCLLGRTLETCEIVFAEYCNGSMEMIADFCKRMCDNPRIVKECIYGGNDWYCNYGDNDFERIIRHTKRIVECSPENCNIKPYMVIDDGWQACHSQETDDIKYYNGGPWYSNVLFGDMEKVASDISAEGAIPGIWIRPLLSMEKVPEECVLRREGNRICLDPSHPEILEMVKNDFKRLKSWGFKLIKYDFTTFDILDLWGCDIEKKCEKTVCFFDKTKTTAQIIKELYIAIREAVGDEVLLMGCNTVSHLSAGIVDLQRTGDDTSGLDWERTKKYGINTLAFRMAQHNTFYCVDADCVGITNNIEWTKNKQWLDVLSKSGTPLFVSIADDAYTEEIKNDITEAFQRAAVNRIISYPLDWKTNKTPEKWKSIYGEDKYEW